MSFLKFTDKGLLPPSDFEITLADLKHSMLVTGKGSSNPAWDSGWRESLVENLEALVRQLWTVGITEIFIDGSFVEDKAHPNDIDGYFECDLHYLASGALVNDLNKQDANKIWNWDPSSRRSYPGFAKKQLPMWHFYRVELFPHYGQLCGIRDVRGNELEFPAAFRQTRDNTPRGILKIVR